MTDWRDIPASDIEWADNPISQRQGYAINFLCRAPREEASSYSARFGKGAWADKALGEIANMGNRHWLRMNGIGPKGAEVIAWIIDEAAEGRCPMKPASGQPATDAYVPKVEREAGE